MTQRLDLVAVGEGLVVFDPATDPVGAGNALASSAGLWYSFWYEDREDRGEPAQ